jgi:hypothetical protein
MVKIEDKSALNTVNGPSKSPEGADLSDPPLIVDLARAIRHMSHCETLWVQGESVLHSCACSFSHLGELQYGRGERWQAHKNNKVVEVYGR